MKAIIYIFALSALLLTSCKSQIAISLINYQSELETEWIDGELWAYRSDDNFVVGMSAFPANDDYGKYYQIKIAIMNLSNNSVVFNPSDVTALLAAGRDVTELNVYTNDEYQKMITRKQRWAMALNGFAEGLSAGSAGYSTTYVNGYAYTTYNYGAAAAANMAASDRIYYKSKLLEYEKNMKQVGYLKMNTIHPAQGISGYMNIERDGDTGILVVDIPVDGKTYQFQWNVKYD